MAAPDLRRPFGAGLSVAAQTVRVPSLSYMSVAQEHEMLTAFNRYGFAILRCAEHGGSRQDLLGLRRRFGVPAPHPRADGDGIVPISPAEPVTGFLGSSRAEHLLHTDGAFRDRPEALITLQCVRPAVRGGLSVLASAQAAYLHLARHFPGRRDALAEPDALTITRTDQSSTQPLFRRRGGVLTLRFRMADGVSRVVPRPDVRDQYAELCRFFAAPANRLRFKLAKGDVLIADNSAVVHGRTPIPAGVPRVMRRLNFDATGPTCARMAFGFPAAPARP
ncbi:TauD/TfdA family dioxygenase [Streptomyces sp. CB02923]|uniref:TauD/TfdA family dioxygenase n=1 Tax=Streptomyces sp. CB02923 TaxID=1718985 RepID=UPI00093E6903|nr:TauD/TfdA family dioxygenase [Streptomyces sp. CB02923]